MYMCECDVAEGGGGGSGGVRNWVVRKLYICIYTVGVCVNVSAYICMTYSTRIQHNVGCYTV